MGSKFSHGRYDIVLPLRIFVTLKVTSDNQPQLRLTVLARDPSFPGYWWP